jgi:hypothetical protein
VFVAAVMVAAAATGAFAADRPSSISVPATALAAAKRLSPPGPQLGGCSMYPGDNAWNTDISAEPVLEGSAAMISRLAGNLHPDFGEDQSSGIPYVVVPDDQALVPVRYDAYGDESDPGPFPIPIGAPVEAGSDGHVLVLRQGSCDLFELFDARPSGNGWVAGAGARFDLASNALRPLGWTSADAAGLPILPGLVRADEVAAGHIGHAIRVTFSRTRRGYIFPATHAASSSTDVDLPAMGQRLRLKSSYDTSRLHGAALVIATAMQRYGLIVADNGSNWYFQGGTSPAWNDDDLNQLKGIPGSAFEAVDTGPVHPG